MKRAFTLLELILVIVVIGILAAMIFPRLNDDRLEKATLRFMEALRYTQHLAMVDDKYISDVSLSPYSGANEKIKSVQQWFKGWWMIWVWKKNGQYVDSCKRSGPGVVVFSDTPSNNANYKYNLKPTITETAIDPQTGKRIAACISGNTGYVNDDYNFNKKFGVVKIKIITPCVPRNLLAFDELGRPHCAYSLDNNSTTPYKNILKSQIKYKLCADSACTVYNAVCVEPETGFIHRCD